ncbi:ATP-dependent endonuclease, partial [Candidatus Gracilibacteria bacterium]
MYLSNIKLWNFRKYGPANNFESNPNLDLNFEPGLNVLIGANDSGKTAILDAIKLVLRPNTGEWIRIDIEEDFHNGKNKMKIELAFENFSNLEA